MIALVPAESARRKVAGVLAKGLSLSEEQMMYSLVLRVVTKTQGCYEELSMSFRRSTFHFIS